MHGVMLSEMSPSCTQQSRALVASIWQHRWAVCKQGQSPDCKHTQSSKKANPPEVPPRSQDGVGIGLCKEGKDTQEQFMVYC